MLKGRRYGARIPALAMHDQKSWKRKSGQAMTEYVVVAGTLMASVAVLALLLYVFKEYGGRILNLVASEYP